MATVTVMVTAMVVAATLRFGRYRAQQFQAARRLTELLSSQTERSAGVMSRI
jgi:hypothetical protein